MLSYLAQSGVEPGGLIYMIDRVARAPLSLIVLFAGLCTLVRLAVHPVLMRTPVHQRGLGFGLARLVNEFSDAVVYAAIVVFMLVRPFGIQTFFIPTGSMIDTLRLQDYIVANKLIYRTQEPKAGDIVVFKPPKVGLLEGQGDTDYIKRLIGVPGDVIEIRDNQLYRNGKPANEPYVTYTYPTSLYGPIGTVPMPKEERDQIRLADFKLVKKGEQYVPVQNYGLEVNSAVTGTAPVYRVESQDGDDAEFLRRAKPAAIPAGYYLMMGDNRNGSYDGRAWGLVPRSSLIGRSEFIWLPVSRMRQTR